MRWIYFPQIGAGYEIIFHSRWDYVKTIELLYAQQSHYKI